MAQNQDRQFEDLQKKIMEVLLDAMRMAVREMQAGAQASEGEPGVIEQMSEAKPPLKDMQVGSSEQMSEAKPPLKDMQVGSSEPMSTEAGEAVSPPAPASTFPQTQEAASPASTFPQMQEYDLPPWPEREEGERDAQFRQRVVQTQKMRQWIKANEVEEQVVELDAEPQEEQVAAGAGQPPSLPAFVEQPPPPDDQYDVEEEQDRVYPTGHEKQPISDNQRRSNEAMDEMFESLNRFLERLYATLLDTKDRVDDMESDFMARVGH